MSKYFNTEGPCYPKEHYMVNLDLRIQEIKKLIDSKKYFSINRGRQYGKTTTLDMLQEKLRSQYSIFYISFEGLGQDAFQNESAFCRLFAGLLYDTIDYGEIDGVEEAAALALKDMSKMDSQAADFRALSNLISMICKTSEKPVVLMIDEVDQAGSQPIFLSFLGMLRSKYLKMRQRPTFESVILAGVYDIRNLKLKIRSEQEHQKNSPWNIAAEFDVNMGFDAGQIQEMLFEYELDHSTGMDIEEMSKLLYSYTSGYPFLVSRLCKILDEKIPGIRKISDEKVLESSKIPDYKTANNKRFGGLISRSVGAYKTPYPWTKEGFLEAIKILSFEKNPLFDSLVNKLYDYPELGEMIRSILFTGNSIPYNSGNHVIDIATMFGFIKNDHGAIAIANRIFETRLYDLFLSEKEVNSGIFKEGNIDKNQFVQNGILDMDHVLKKFMEHWNDLYHSADEKFIEENGRKFFLLYLKPIINGTGNYYIESRTRDNRRTDIIVDYRGQQYIIEVKIWRENEYHTRGEAQLADYLEAYHAKKGYLLSFNFNKNKKVGAKEVICGDKVILEIVV